MKKLLGLLKSKKGKELVGYVFFGVLTTVVNIAAFTVLDQALHVYYLVANVLSWVIAVLFAYVTNKLFVFKTRNLSRQALLKEIGLFFTARVFSLGVDEAGMFLLVDLLLINKTISKVVMNVVVVILNYVFSKLFIFKQKKEA